ncbi:hypothetical protein U472_00260 [Orenia metallireducens]|uniref:Uncharacterized protein n=1 Tax=Orenia metallireducens TaxID=1413210 RepID=A0A1C0ADG7_9FIRM|nr:hypothetical protein U472_00260 [Orenia metallireducens]
MGIARKFKPEIDSYFSVARPVLEEVDDIIDLAFNEFPNNQYLANANKISDKVISELEEAGYKIDNSARKKIENRAKAKIVRKSGK